MNNELFKNPTTLTNTVIQDFIAPFFPTLEISEFLSYVEIDL